MVGERCADDSGAVMMTEGRWSPVDLLGVGTMLSQDRTKPWLMSDVAQPGGPPSAARRATES